MQLLQIGASEVRATLSMEDCIEAMYRAMRALSAVPYRFDGHKSKAGEIFPEFEITGCGQYIQLHSEGPAGNAPLSQKPCGVCARQR